MTQAKTALLLGVLTGLFLLVGDALGGRSGAVIALGFAAVTNLGAWWFSDRVVLAMHRAVALSRSDAPDLFDRVGLLASRAGIPMPRLYLVEDPSPNAFATGRNPSHGALAVTSGLLRVLSGEELDAVLAHELGHIRSRDTLITTLAATVAGAIAVLARTVFFFGALPRRDDEREGAGIGGLGLLLVSPFIALLLQLAVSRAREYHADEAGADLLGNGQPLARALSRIEEASQRIPSWSARPVISSLYVVNPFHLGIARLFATHPPTEERIRRLLRKSPSPFLRTREV